MDSVDISRNIRLTLRSLSTIKGNIEQILGTSVSQENVAMLDACIQSFAKTFKELRELTFNELDTIEKLNKTADAIEKEQDVIWKRVIDYETLYCQYSGKLMIWKSLLHITTHERSPVRQSTANPEANNISFMTNSLNLKTKWPEFDGNIRNFASFKSSFLSLISTANVDDSMKLHQLKKCLVKDAENALRDFDLTNQAYHEAWAYLNKRYENKRIICTTLMHDLFNIPAINSEASIRELIDKVESAVRALTINGYEIGRSEKDLASPLIAYYVSSKLDKYTRRDWENSLRDATKAPTYQEIMDFLFARSSSYESRSFLTAGTPVSDKVSKKIEKPVALPTTKRTSFLTTSQCLVCTKAHPLYLCDDFKSKNSYDRYQFIKQNQLCINCLQPGHALEACTCKSTCKKCNSKHHTLLHRDSRPAQVYARTSSQHAPQTQVHSEARHSQTQLSSGIPASSSSVNTDRACMVTSHYDNTVLLVTAVVHVFANGRHVGLARAILDNGSQLSLVTKSFVKRASLSNFRNPFGMVTVMGVAGDSFTNRVSDFTIKSRYNDFKLSLRAEIVDNIPYLVPDEDSHMVNLPNYNYAETNLGYNHVDILIGGAHYERCISNRREFYNDLVIRDTHFGWTVVTSDGPEPKGSLCCNLILAEPQLPDLSQILQKFWEVENHEDTRNVSSEAERCVRHFDETHSRLADGRFVVRLPFKIDPTELGESRRNAEKLLISRERYNRMEIRIAYRDFLEEYSTLGHMTKIDDATSYTGYYIPHQMVTKLTSTTTKYRVVFNASRKTTSGLSLNDTLMVGPCIQPELLDTLIRFRCHSIAITADIEKMYRQVLIHSDDRKYQRILWRDDPHEPISAFELNTVTYGTAPASFLTTKCLAVLADECKSTSPSTSNSINRDFYMDDWLSGAASVSEAKYLLHSVISTLRKGQFNLRKVISNSPELLESLDHDQIEKFDNFDPNPSCHILGIVWHPRTDDLHISTHMEDIPNVISKRFVLSTVARIFDPLGILVPVTINAKILMQSCWRLKSTWDEPVSTEIAQKFMDFTAGLAALSNYYIDRKYTRETDIRKSFLVGFADASEYAYCAVIYLCTVNHSDELSSSIVCSKSKVSPLKSNIKTLTIPRLELCAALLLSELTVRVSKILELDLVNSFVFSDSTTVLAWLKSEPLKQEIFVKNRVIKIREALPNSRWNYVNTRENPADLGTRGITSKKFVDSSLWKCGPSFINGQYSEFLAHLENSALRVCNIGVVETVSAQPAPLSDTMLKFDLIQRFSSYTRLIRSVAYMYRLINYKILDKCNFILDVDEINFSLTAVIKIAQREFFSAELKYLLAGSHVHKKSVLSSLAPFIDTQGVLRVGGRLQNASLSFDRMHQIIMHPSSHLLSLIVRDIHLRYYHANRLFITNFLALKFWVVYGVGRLVKKTIRSCTTCIRYQAQPLSQQMGSLPSSRVTIDRPFARVGIDFAGPLSSKCVGHRTTKFYKVYVCLFVCFVSRAAHLEIVSSLSTEAFLDTLQRFIARRGVPAEIHSDNATNFVGASNILLSSKLVQDYAATRGISWSFIPPRTPHQGGLWEAAVRAAKSHLVRATNGQTLNYEEYVTYLTNIEAILNSRPICYRKVQDNVELLTPAHFLVGSSLLHPAVLHGTQPISYSRRYVLIQQLVHSFWREWSSTYLNQLQLRHKWKEVQPSLKVNDVVLLKTDLLAPSDWRYGRVVEVFPDRNGLVRNCNVVSKSKIRYRNVSSLIRLDVEEHRATQPGEHVDSKFTPDVHLR